MLIALDASITKGLAEGGAAIAARREGRRLLHKASSAEALLVDGTWPLLVDNGEIKHAIVIHVRPCHVLPYSHRLGTDGPRGHPHEIALAVIAKKHVANIDMLRVDCHGNIHKPVAVIVSVSKASTVGITRMVINRVIRRSVRQALELAITEVGTET